MAQVYVLILEFPLYDLTMIILKDSSVETDGGLYHDLGFPLGHHHLPHYIV